MKTISNVYGIVRQSRERIIKTMQERGIKELETFLNYEEWCKEQGKEPEEDADDDSNYLDYRDQAAPFVVHFDKYNTGHDYHVRKVTLVDGAEPAFKFEAYCYESGDATFYEDDVVWATRMFVWERLEELLEIKDEPEEVWVVFDESLDEYQLAGRRIRVFDNEAEARKVFHETVGVTRKVRSAEGWEINEDEDFFETYPDGSWGASHETVELHKCRMGEETWCHG